MKFTQKTLLVFIVLCLCIACDQATKYVARQRLPKSQRIEWLGGSIVLYYTENSGAFLSLGKRLPETARLWAFTILTGVVLAGMLVFVLATREIDRLGVLSMALVIGGGTSNLLDRVCYNGAVVDFMNVGLGWLRTGVFNVADVAIMAGVGLLLFWGFRLDKKSNLII